MKRIVNAVWKGDGMDGDGVFSSQRVLLVICLTVLRPDLKMMMVNLGPTLKS